jgi:hypothetical protein
VRFLFTTLQYVESDFYGRVGAELRRLGHDVVHVTYSRRATRKLRATGAEAYCLPDAMAALDAGPLDVEAEAIRIERQYPTPTLRDVYRTDWVCNGRSEEWCVERTVRHFLALERLFEEVRPDLVVPEVGNETIRTAAHLVGLDRAVPVLFLFYTIFPAPLRLYVDTMHAPIVAPEDVRVLTAEQRAEVEAFIQDFLARDEPIRAYRHIPLTPGRLRLLARHLIVRALWDRDNDYLRPWYWLGSQLRERLRAELVRPIYEPIPSERPFIYFPLHVIDDYKIKRILPHCSDQAAIVEQTARALPHGYDLLIKEHPMSLGRNPISMLRRLRRMRNVRLVDPHTSSHELIARSQAVTVISSTVGLEALLHAKPVLTLGDPFYAGMGVTLDAKSPAQIAELVPAVLDFRPDRDRTLRFIHAAMRRCYPGVPALINRSDANAKTLAGSLADAAQEQVSVREGRAERLSGLGA